MKELNDIIRAYDKAVLQHKRCVLATVVRVDGSSYRRPGARMLVTEDGAITGTISGGCLEGDALRKARLAIHLQENRLEVYDTTDDEDNKLGVQLGCNGVVYILFEPLRPDDPDNPVNLLKKVAQKRKASVLTTVFNRQKNALQTGTCRFFYDDELLNLNDLNIKKDLRIIMEQKTSLVKAYEQHSVLYQYVPPAMQLIIVGAGNDAQPLMDMAFLMGWNIVVADGRPAYATKQRFPKAANICLTKPENILSAVRVDEQTAVVIMTHNYNYDTAALAQFIRTDCNYIGVLGPKQKLHKMLAELEQHGLEMKAMLQKIYGPVGLDIGAETAEEIALSVMAEIKAVFSNREGMSLKKRPFEIHERA